MIEFRNRSLPVQKAAKPQPAVPSDMITRILNMYQDNDLLAAFHLNHLAKTGPENVGRPDMVKLNQDPNLD